MTADEAVVAVLDALQTVTIPYMVVGSLASNFHGIPRATRDADIVVEVPPGDLDRLRRQLPPELTLDRQASFEAVTGTTYHVIRLAGSPFVCELFVLSDDAHDQARFLRRQRAQMLDQPAHVASAEDMVITKLRWAMDARRAKDREDARNILAVRGDDLDWDYVERWADVHGTRALLDELRTSI